MIWQPATSLPFTNLQKTLPFTQSALASNKPSSPQPSLSLSSPPWMFSATDLPWLPPHFLWVWPPTQAHQWDLLGKTFKIAAPFPSPNALHTPSSVLFFQLYFNYLIFYIFMHFLFCFIFHFICSLYTLLLDVSSLRKGALSVLYTLIFPLPRKLFGTEDNKYLLNG